MSDFQRFAGRRVLITGGLGFIGSNLARSLCDLGAHVTVVDSLIPEYGGNLFNLQGYEDRIRVNIADIRDEFSLAVLVRDQDYLFNLAGQTSHLDSMKNPFTDLDINCRSQLFILEACRNHNPSIKIVFASTRQIYGRPEFLPVHEAHPLHPTDINGVHKLAGEWYHLLYNNIYGIRSCALRLTNTFGPRMRVRDARQTFLGVWIRNLIQDKSLEVWGDGCQIRDFNFVDDVVEAMLLAMLSEDADGQVYNLGGPEHIRLHDLADLLVRTYGKGDFEVIPFPQDRKPIDIGDYFGDYRKIECDLGWHPKTRLEKGLATTLQYYVAHLENYL